ncbi:uncharacterized protein LOC143052414 [Mytilus galloprovincialis]|uniref:uncharacterized protein LOC143052414 n=1 Tax=Mytilus galloprovincialis TaxID=29158 RepID=UPI003F7B6753
MATINDLEGFNRLMQSCIVLFDIHPTMLRDMFLNSCPPITLDKKIQNAGKNFMNSLHKTEKTVVRNMKTKGYREMDGSLLYKLIRYFELVDMPSEGWGKEPKPHALNQGDDVERLRYLRNSVFHRTESAMKPTESKSFFEGFRQCAERLDQFLQRPTKVYTDRIMEVQSKTVDDASSLTYHEMFDNTLQLTETLSWNKCHKVEVDSSGFYKITLYCSSALREEIGNDANKEKEHTMQCDNYDTFLVPESKFCNKCGEIIDKTSICSKCNNAVSKENNYCSKCGEQLRREDGSKDVKIVITGLPDNPVILEAIQRETICINELLSFIKVNYIEKGSVVLLVSIANMASLSLQKLSKQVQLFVYMILEIPDINGRMKNDLDILLLPVDFVITTEKEYTMQCDNCDTLLLPDSKFCNKCGVHIDKKFICSNCNNAVSNEKNDCPKCGEQLRRDSDTLKTTVNIPEQNRDSRFLQAQSAIKGLGSFQEVKQLMKKINEEGSERLVEHINKTLDKWKKEKVKFRLAGGTGMGKSSFINALMGHTEENRAKTSAYGNTTVSTTEYFDISFTDCPGYGTPDSTYRAYFRQNFIDSFDYVLIFFYAVTTDVIWFAKTLEERKMKFCFVRTKLDIDVNSARFDKAENTDPESIASTLRKKAVDAFEKQGLSNPFVFVISNRRKDIGHFPDLLSHIEQVLHKEKYQALIYQISTYTRDTIIRKHRLLCERINSVTMRAVVEEGEEATDCDSGNVEDEKKGIKLQQTVRCLERELLFYIETFELNKKTSIALIGQERVSQKLKFARFLTSGIENYIADFITKELEILLDESTSDQKKFADDDMEQYLEYPFLHPSRKLLSKVLDGLQEDAFIIFEEFQKEEC